MLAGEHEIMGKEFHVSYAKKQRVMVLLKNYLLLDSKTFESNNCLPGLHLLPQ